MAKALQTTTLLLFLLANSGFPLPERKPADRTFLRGLINLRKQIIPYTSAVERRLINELPHAPNSPYLDPEYLESLRAEDSSGAGRRSRNARITSESVNRQRTKDNARRIRDRGNANSLNQHSKIEQTTYEIPSNVHSQLQDDENSKIESEEVPFLPNASLLYSSSYSNVEFPTSEGQVNHITSQSANLANPSQEVEDVVVQFPTDETTQRGNVSLATSSGYEDTSSTGSPPSISPHDVQAQPESEQTSHVFISSGPHRVRVPANIRNRITEKPSKEPVPQRNGIFESFMARLRQLPVLGNVLRATVDPVYRPLINSILPVMAENRQSTSEEFKEEIHCVEALGCFATTIEFYDPIFRPINLPPDTRRDINTHYTLYTRKQTDGVPVRTNNINRIRLSSYNPNIPTKFIIHGFLDDQNSTWIKDMVRGLLYHGDYNVFVVDWSGGSRVIYNQAVTNIQVVALEIGALINWMGREMGQQPSKVHIIGHSLGSHAAGYVGSHVKGLGRITGLDPAEPFFQHMPPAVRLDPSDANFVDVIHTDSDSIMTLAWQFAGYGLEQPVGHVDFYPNGGKEQPGCSSLSRIPLVVLQEGAGIAEGIDAAEKEAVACNHIRANKLFTASLFDTCSFLAFPCKSYSQFEGAECFSCDSEVGCAQLGINADAWKPHGRKHVKMFLSTSNGPDFCQYHYRLTLTMADSGNVGGSLRGRLKVTLITENGELEEFDLSKERGPLTLRRGTSRSFLLRHGMNLSGTREALLHWEFEADVFNPLTFCMLFCTTDLEIAAMTLTPLDTGTGGTELQPKSLPPAPADIVMCHKQGNPHITISSERTVKVSAEPFCQHIKQTQEGKRS